MSPSPPLLDGVHRALSRIFLGGRMRSALSLLAALGVVTAASAQAPSNEPPKDKGLYITLDQMEAIKAAIPTDKQGKPGSFSKRLFAASTFSTAFIRLNAPDTPHAHGIWSEVFVVREGSGELETGGTITGVTGNDSATHKDIFVDQTPGQKAAAKAGATRRAAEGDLAGTDIEGGHKQTVKAGDIILIPAGVAHRWSRVDQSVVYLDIKFPKAS
jgi:mannose-6-phosphate isomerase-like protein (cupin superfamily)